jgi:aminoglycoside 6'-N-acetyltransferase I
MAEAALEFAALSPDRAMTWAELRHELWPATSAADHVREAGYLQRSRDYFVLLAIESGVVGFAEAAIRRCYVNGCESLPGEPVAFLEGIYVKPAYRRRGIARALCERVAAWAHTLGATELASDALLDNTDSHAMHRALGFAETQRVVFFRRTLPS